MALDALRGYLQIASGLTDVTRQRAVATAKQLLDQGGDLVDQAVSAPVSRQVQAMADEILTTSRTNRDLLVGLIRTEVDRAVARLGLVGGDELASMAKIVARLQRQVDANTSARGGEVSDAGVEPEVAPAATKAPVKKAPVKKAPAKKAAAKKAPAKKAPAKKAAAKKAPAKKSVAKAAVPPPPEPATPPAPHEPPEANVAPVAELVPESSQETAPEAPTAPVEAAEGAPPEAGGA